MNRQKRRKIGRKAALRVISNGRNVSFAVAAEILGSWSNKKANRLYDILFARRIKKEVQA